MKNITLHLNSITLSVTSKEAKALQEVSITGDAKLKKKILDKFASNLESGDAYESAEEE
jgi:hypothetical protein